MAGQLDDKILIWLLVISIPNENNFFENKTLRRMSNGFKHLLLDVILQSDSEIGVHFWWFSTETTMDGIAE